MLWCFYFPTLERRNLLHESKLKSTSLLLIVSEFYVSSKISLEFLFFHIKIIINIFFTDNGVVDKTILANVISWFLQ